MKLHANALQLIDLLSDEDKSGVEVARTLNVTEARVSQLRKKLKIDRIGVVTIEHAGEITGKHIDAADQLAKVNTAANRILDRLTDHIDNGKDLPPENQRKDSMELVARYCQEIRAQLSLQMDIYKSLYDIKVIAAFQQSVLEAINEVSPETKDRIVQKLKEARAIRPNLQL